MKNKGVILSILIILCFGAFVTVNIRQFVTAKPETIAPAETYKSSMLPEFAKAAVPPEEENAAAAEAPEAAAPEPASPQGEQPETALGEVQKDESFAADRAALPEAAAETAPLEETALESVSDQGTQAADGSSQAVISPLTGSRTGEPETASVFQKEEYEEKLKSLETQIQEMKASGVEPNTDSYKNMADYEYRSWDSELNIIYQALMKCMTAEEAEKLRLEEREWMKNRDQTAHKAISKYNGGTIESLEYTASLADSTKTRAYELLEKYGEYLDRASGAES